MSMDRRTAVRNVHVFDGQTRSGPRTVVIDGGILGADPASAEAIDGAQMIDGTGATLLPGLIDAHVHLRAPENLTGLAVWGVTTGLDMACWPAERVTTLRAATAGAADFRTAGLPAIGPGGQHSRMPGMPPEAVIHTADDARRFAAARAAEGVDYIKGVAEAPGDGGPSPEALTALVEAARAQDLRTVVHAASVGAYSTAVASGAEFITHEPVTGVIRAEDATAMGLAGQVAVPTITMMEGVLATRFGRDDVTELLASFDLLRRAGVEVLAGTDANDAPGAPGRVGHGSSLHHEFDLMARAGMSPVDILRSSTSRTAELFGLADRGVIAPGKRADLVLVDGDPTTDIGALRHLRTVWCRGVEVVGVTEAT